MIMKYNFRIGLYGHRTKVRIIFFQLIYVFQSVNKYHISKKNYPVAEFISSFMSGSKCTDKAVITAYLQIDSFK